MQRFCEDCRKETTHDQDIIVYEAEETESKFYICKECGHIDVNVGPIDYEDSLREG